jgi:chemotaxis protein CheD
MTGYTVCPEKKSHKTYSKTFLSIGSLLIAEKPMHIWTVLGPCISVILYSPGKKTSAICHAQLVEKEFLNNNCVNQELLCLNDKKNFDFRYVVCSIKYMIESLLISGLKKTDIYASIYGGSQNSDSLYSIGLENINIAVALLQEYRIKIIKTDVGGNKSRVIRHYSDTGITDVKYFEPSGMSPATIS